MRILPDENLPESLVAALRGLGHEVDSVNSLALKGLDDITLYLRVGQSYDLCLTKDAGFVHNVSRMRERSGPKLLRVILPQQPAVPFVESFVRAFQQTDWSQQEHCSDWP